VSSPDLGQGYCKTVQPEKQKVGRIAAANPRRVEMTAGPFWFSLYQNVAPRKRVTHLFENEAPNWRIAPIREAFAPNRAKLFPSPRRPPQKPAQKPGNNTCRSKEQDILSKLRASFIAVDEMLLKAGRYGVAGKACRRAKTDDKPCLQRKQGVSFSWRAGGLAGGFTRWHQTARLGRGASRLALSCRSCLPA